MARNTSKPPLPMGRSGLPNLDNFDYEHTSTRHTETREFEAPPSHHPAQPIVTVVTGGDAGRIVSFHDDAVTIGRSTECDLVLPDSGISRRHARITRSGSSFFVEDLGAKNGTFVDSREVHDKEAIDVGATIQLGPSVLVRLVMMTAAEQALATQLFDSSMRDALTGTYNRRFAMDRLHAEVSFAKRHSGALSIGIIDFDLFKQINDTYGHPVGDLVLVKCAQTIAATLRSEDVLARFGGEEFVFVLRGIAHPQAIACAERIREAVAQSRITAPNGGLVRVTVSIGLASIDDCEKSPSADGLIAIADERLYAAKRSGRNRIRGRA